MERLKARRWRDGTFEYLVVWEPKSNGDPWYDTWEPENYITEELKEAFKSTAGHAMEAAVLASWAGELLRQLARTSPPPERGSAQVFSARGSRCAPAHTRPTRPVVTY